MPLIRISVFHEMAAERRLKIAAAVYDAMRSTLGIPEGDRFIVLSAHSQDELILDPHFMHVQRTSEFVLVHVTLRRGRSIETKQSFYKEAARLLEVRADIAPDNIMVALTENDSADWSFAKGEAQYVLYPPVGAQTQRHLVERSETGDLS
jgi:4-oxalocrotonate tautomerase